MIKSKPKKCIVCERDDLPHFSHGMCIYCAKKEYSKKKNTQTVKQSATKKGDSGLQPYYNYHIKQLQKKLICENCGQPIKPYLLHSNIAHILPKSKYKSVSTNIHNYLYLCSGKDDNSIDCHYTFDYRGSEIRKNMEVFELAKQRYNLFKDEVVENGNLREELL